jgi:hypothetical protein
VQAGRFNVRDAGLGHTTPPPSQGSETVAPGREHRNTRLKVLITNPVQGPAPVERLSARWHFQHPPLSPSPCEIAQSPCLPGPGTHLPISDQAKPPPNQCPSPAPVGSWLFASNATTPCASQTCCPSTCHRPAREGQREQRPSQASRWPLLPAEAQHSVDAIAVRIRDKRGSELVDWANVSPTAKIN